MPSKSKAKNATAAHQHDKRHESGLAAPGKRVIRQRSNQNLQQQQQNGHVNGRPNGSAVSSTVNTSLQSSLSSTAVDHGYDIPRSSATEILRPAPSHSPGSLQQRDHVDTMTRDRTYSDASNDGFDGFGEGMEDGTYYSSGMGGMRRPSTYGQQPKSTLEIMSTILTYYPLRDAIFILILLLSLPPTVVPLIQALFASLTFVPPSTAISITSIKELFHASSLGYPALMAVLIVDLIFYLCWLPVWKPMQSMLLDLSQAVIAVSLSGAAASTAGPTYSFLSCSAVVCAVHVLRYRAIHLTAFDYLRSVLAKLEIGIDLSVFPAIPTTNSFFCSLPTAHDSWIYTAVRTFLGIHIISQGITTSVRRSLASANERSNHIPAIAKSDPEASAGQDFSNRSSNSGTPDPIQHPLNSQSLDNRAAASNVSSTVHRDGKGRESSSKQRKRQANEVRSKQPLWAAIASTKVTFVKEMEQRDAADDVKEANNMNRPNNVNKIPSFPLKTISPRLWVEEVRDTEIIFRAELSLQALASQDNEDCDITVGHGVDKTKPFYVRVNTASWTSVKIRHVRSAQQDVAEYQCEIFGLAPLSYYLCEIVSTSSHEVLCCTRSITQAAHTAEQQTPVLTTPTQHPNLRPSSPVSTLRKSIEQASASLMEARTKSKKTKKDQKAAYSDIRREVNTFKNKLEHSGGADDRQAKRLQQMTQHKTQADEAVLHLAKQIEELGDIPPVDVEAADTHKREWRSAENAKTAAYRTHQASKLDNDGVTKDAKSELNTADSKLHKLRSRTEQRREELAALSAKQEAEASARLKHTQERAVIKQGQEKRDHHIRQLISTMNHDAEVHNSKATEAWNQASALYSTWPPSHLPYSSPPTPEDMQQQINGLGSHQAYNAYQTQHAHHVAPVIGPRGRSSSMLSQYSGFTENGEDQPFEIRPHSTWLANRHINGAAIDDRKESEGSSNGSSGTNGSTASSSPRPDARTFVPSAKMGPIRPPPRNKTSSPHALEIASPSPPPPGRNGIER